MFDAGWAHFQMVLSQKAKPIKDNVRWTIYRFTGGGVEEKAKLSELTAPSAQLILPKGWYMVRGQYQGIVSELAAEVKAGTLYGYTIVAYAGKLTFAVVDAKGKAVKKDVLWSIERVSKANGGKPTRVGFKIIGKGDDRGIEPCLRPERLELRQPLGRDP